MRKSGKFIYAAIICILLSVWSIGGEVFAIDEDLIFTDVFECIGNVYFCDPNEETVVLKNLNHQEIPDEILRTDIKNLIEYTEIPIFLDGISAAEGGKISGEDINSYYTDTKVRVIIARNGRGYKVIHMICGIK